MIAPHSSCYFFYSDQEEEGTSQKHKEYILQMSAGRTPGLAASTHIPKIPIFQKWNNNNNNNQVESPCQKIPTSQNVEDN